MATRSRGSAATPNPTPPLEETDAGGLFACGAEAVGAHPFRVPTSDLGQTYVNPCGLTVHPCTWCGSCQRFGCGYMAKSTPQICVLPAVERRPDFELRTSVWVQRVEKHEDGRRVLCVT